jgi:hypothetical protein
MTNGGTKGHGTPKPASPKDQPKDQGSQKPAQAKK